MPVTLADYARSLPPVPSYGRRQRLLCRLGIHRGHRAYHDWQRRDSIIQSFMDSMPELADVPWKKMNGSTYTYKSEAD